jgi:serpin B
MKKVLLFLIALTISFRSDAEPLGNELAAKQFALGVKLLQHHESGKNATLSPYSIHAALMLARLGAKGRTAAEMDSILLSGPYSRQSLDEYAALTRAISSSSEGLTTTVANSVWLTDRGTFRAEYLRDAQNIFSADPHTINFTASESARETINRWVASKTNSLIEHLLPPGSITPTTVSTLINTLYFKAPWMNPFKKESTQDETFWLGPNSEAKAPLMHLSHNSGYFENDSWQAVHLPYQGNQFFLALLVPKSRIASEDVLSALSPRLFADATTEQAFVKVNLHLPRFTIRESQNLTSALSTIGFANTLSGSADFSGIASIPVTISSVQHEAVVMVDEQGTEAAAATSMAFAGAAFMPHPPQPKDVRADHPFAFAIIHRQSRAPLFLGVVGDPR